MANTRPRGVCVIDGCGRPHEARGWCQPHYERWRAHGNPLAGRTAPGELQGWVDAHHAHEGDECLAWPFSGDKDGYPVFGANKKNVRVARYICEHVYGPPPTPQSQAAHKCGRQWCVNRRHLRWATPRGNNQDKLLHGTQPMGETVYCAKLSEEDARFVFARAWRGDNQGLIAADFDISQSHVSGIKHGRFWKHLHEGGQAQ